LFKAGTQVKKLETYIQDTAAETESSEEKLQLQDA
jgi:hypothetical protein